MSHTIGGCVVATVTGALHSNSIATLAGARSSSSERSAPDPDMMSDSPLPARSSDQSSGSRPATLTNTWKSKG